MKHLKMLGLAAIAALGLMAFVGAGVASASTALSTDSAGTIKYATGTVVDATLSGTAILESGSTTLDTCTGGTVKGATTNETGASVTGNISALTWTGCTNTTDTTALGSLSITKGTGDTGSVSGSGSKVTVNTLGVTCTYGTGTGTTLGTITGGSEPSLNISTTVPKIEGSFICPSSASWTATYIVTEPHAVHIVE
jgi:fibronectin-binding autotransporter adhesin